jgi:hypothetical protein
MDPETTDDFSVLKKSEVFNNPKLGANDSAPYVLIISFNVDQRWLVRPGFWIALDTSDVASLRKRAEWFGVFSFTTSGWLINEACHTDLF